MPVMDGGEAMLEIRRTLSERQAAHPVIVAVTAKALPGDRAAALANGFDAYVAKPIKLDEVRRALCRSRVHSCRARRQSSAVASTSGQPLTSHSSPRSSSPPRTSASRPFRGGTRRFRCVGVISCACRSLAEL